MDTLNLLIVLLTLKLNAVRFSKFSVSRSAMRLVKLACLVTLLKLQPKKRQPLPLRFNNSRMKPCLFLTFTTALEKFLLFLEKVKLMKSMLLLARPSSLKFLSSLDPRALVRLSSVRSYALAPTWLSSNSLTSLLK